MKILLDANILVRAAMSPGGPAAGVLELIHSGKHELVCSSLLVDETRRILGDARLRQYHGLTDSAIAEFIESVAAMATYIVVPASVPRIVPLDPLDDHVVFAAEAAGAEVICTRDRHLLAAEVLARSAKRGLRVVDDLRLLAELRAD